MTNVLQPKHRRQRPVERKTCFIFILKSGKDLTSELADEGLRVVDRPNRRHVLGHQSQSWMILDDPSVSLRSRQIRVFKIFLTSRSPMILKIIFPLRVSYETPCLTAGLGLNP